MAKRTAELRQAYDQVRLVIDAMPAGVVVIDARDHRILDINPAGLAMLGQTREKDLEFMINLSKSPRPKNRSEVGLTVLIPSFILSEIKTGFEIGFLIYIPFLIIDIVVASILVSLGMVFLPPVMVSLPFKVILFIIADGWTLLIGALVKSFGG